MIQIDQEPDNVPKRLISRSGLVVTLAILASIIATIGLQRGAVFDVLHIKEPAPVRIDMTPFEMPTDAELMRAQAEQHLRRYGWVNRQTGTVHVPLDVAIERYLGAQQR